MVKNILLVGNESLTDDAVSILTQLGDHTETVFEKSQIWERSRQKNVDVILFDNDSYSLRSGKEVLRILKGAKKPFIIVSSVRTKQAVLEAKKAGSLDYIVKPYNKREFITRFNAVTNGKIRVACLGGGTGLLNLLMGLKTVPELFLTSVVSTSDDGGSSGRLRSSFGILPPGDIRRSLVALSNAPELMNEVMKYRFEKGKGLAGHSFGNLFLAALADIKGSMADAVKELGDILYIQGIVLPITMTQTKLCALFENGKVVKGESKIDLGKGRNPDLHIKKIWHEPEPLCDIDSFSAIMNADIVTIGPGDLFTSIITNLSIKCVKEALVKTKAKKIYVCNLMTKPGETSHYDVCDHVREVLKYIGRDCLDYIILSNTKLSRKAAAEYLKKGQEIVDIGDIRRIYKFTKARVVLSDVSHETELVRHDSMKLRNEIKKIIEKECVSGR